MCGLCEIQNFFLSHPGMSHSLVESDFLSEQSREKVVVIKDMHFHNLAWVIYSESQVQDLSLVFKTSVTNKRSPSHGFTHPEIKLMWFFPENP